MKHLNISMVPYISFLTFVVFFLTGLTGVSAAILPQHTHSAKPCGAWSQVTSPNVGTSYNTLNGVAAISAHNVWAVGAYGNGNGSFTLVEHWTGTQWQVVASPNVKGSLSDSLSGIVAITATNIWAVGSYNNASNDSQTLIEHWNGSAWSVVSSSGPGLAINTLNGVTAISTSNIWAVGEDTNSSAPSAEFNPLIEHWNGSTWKAVTSPSPGSVVSDLAAAARVPATTSVWAVGYTQDTNSQTFTVINC